jgi:hypothetical protein
MPASSRKMTQAIQFCLTGLCLVIYVPIFVNAVQQIARGEVVLHGRSIFRGSSRRYTGASVWAYAGGRALSSLILITGGLSAVQRDDLGFLILTLLVSWFIGLASVQLADRIGYEELADPHAEAMNLLHQMLSTTTRIWNQEAANDYTGEKDRPNFITFGDNLSEDIHLFQDDEPGDEGDIETDHDVHDTDER